MIRLSSSRLQLVRLLRKLFSHRFASTWQLSSWLLSWSRSWSPCSIASRAHRRRSSWLSSWRCPSSTRCRSYSCSGSRLCWRIRAWSNLHRGIHNWPRLVSLSRLLLLHLGLLGCSSWPCCWRSRPKCSWPWFLIELCFKLRQGLIATRFGRLWDIRHVDNFFFLF